MHKCILKLLKSHIEAMLREFHTADGSWKQLKENLQLVQQWNPQELGVFVPTPDFVDVEKMKVKFVTMQKMHSPEKKVMLLLRVCKLIYTVMENNSGRLYGADDFLPVLTYVLVQGDTLELDTETEYMVELLDPSLLHGEGGYYLASTYGALVLIKNFQEDQSAQLLSSEARDNLWRWHKRRTTNKTMASVDDFQNYLHVAFQEVNSACTGKTLLVRPYITTADVCQLCAEKFKVDNPEEYSLFLFVDDTRQQLTEDTYPQKIKTELHGRPQPQVFRSVYKHINGDPYALGKVEGSVAGEEWHGRVTALSVAPEFQRLGLVAVDELMKLLGEISEKKGGFFVDLFVRVSNRVAVNMYKQLGYRVYQTVLERYSASSGEPDEDAYNTRKALSRDTEKSIIPLPHPVRPEDTE